MWVIQTQMRSMPRALLLAALLCSLCADADAAEVAEVKSYLVGTLEKMKRASADFVANTSAYAALTAANGGPERAFAAKKGEVQKLVAKLQDDYKTDLTVVCVNLDDTPVAAAPFAAQNASFATHLHQPAQPGQPSGMNGPLATQYGIFGLPQRRA